MKTLLILSLSFIILSNKTYAQSCSSGYFNIGPRLLDKFSTYEKKLALNNRIFDIDKARENEDAFKNLDRKYKEAFVENIAPYIQRYVHYQYLGVLNFKLTPNLNLAEREKITNEMTDVIENAFMHYKLLVRELAEDPLINSSDKNNIKKLSQKIKAWLAEFSLNKENFKTTSIQTIKQCVNNEMLTVNEKNQTSIERISILKKCLHGSPLVGKGNFDLAKELGDTWWHKGDIMSPTGFIPGNSVELFYKNPSDLNNFYKMQKGYNLFKQDVICKGENMGPYVKNLENGKKKILANVDFFKNLLKKDCEPFTEEGFSSIETHPTFVSIPETRDGAWKEHEKSIFKKIRDGLDLVSIASKEKTTLFIDIFFLGESLGASIAKKIVQALELNPNLYVFILRDLENHYGHSSEMMPIFNYLRAISESRKDGRLVITRAELNFHPTGLPNWFNDIMPRNAQDFFGGNMDLSPMAKADHSKVMIINGANLEGQALGYISSKNWLDTSGGSNFDELLFVTGPAVNLMQDNHTMDMVKALTKGDQKFYLDNIHGQLKLPNKEVNNLNDPRLSRLGMNLEELNAFIKAQQIIEAMGFHVFNHEEAHKDELKANPICSKMNGHAIISIGENNFNSHIRTPLIQNLYLINHSTKPIYISDQLFAEPNLVQSVINAAKQRNITSNILLTYLPESPGITPENFPNVFFMAEMLHKDKGSPQNINIYLKQLYGSSGDSEVQGLQEEFHKKTTTGGNEQWDIHISGSANKGFMTMRGAFRETQLMVFQKSVEADTLAKEAIAIFNDIPKLSPKSNSPLVEVSKQASQMQQQDRDGAVKVDEISIDKTIINTPWLRSYMNFIRENSLETLSRVKSSATGMLFMPISTETSEPDQKK